MFDGKLATLGGLLAAAVLGVSLPACAQPLRITPYGEGPGAANPPVAHYMAALERRAFVLDRVAAAPQVLLRFDDNPEVWVLEPSPAPGGGKIYRNDAGDRVLSQSSLGFLTLFTARDPDGLAVSIVGDADQLLPPPALPLDALLLRGVQAAVPAERAVQHQITFTASDVQSRWTPIFVESFNIAAEAIVKLSREKKAKGLLAKLDTVQFIAGPKPDVNISGSVMTITLAPNRGFAGRPSSNRIMKTCLKK